MNPTNGPQVNIKTNVDVSDASKQISDLMKTASRSIGTLTKQTAQYERNLSRILADLEGITRAGSNAGQTVRDLSLAGGGSVAGRVRQSNQRARKSEITQISEVLTADLVNFTDQVHRSVAKSLKSAMRVQLAKNRQDLASIDAEIRAAQIEAQRTRVAFATQLSGTRGNVRGTITENANAAGVQGLGTLRAEQAALDKLLATDKLIVAENLKIKQELRHQEQLQGRINRLVSEKNAPLQRQIEMAQKQTAIERENLRIAQAQASGNQALVLKSRMKQEALRLDTMALRGVREESAEYQNQLARIRSIHIEQMKLNAEKQKGNTATREAAALERSRQFAAGQGTQAEIARNQMIGGRRNASSLEGRASLLGMQGNLLMNYGILGGGVAAIHGMTSAVVDLDAKLRELQAIAGATNGQFESLRSVVIKTSEDTKFSAVELAESATLLAQVGQSAEEIENTLPVISSFAMAVGTDMKNAVDIVTTSLTVFNMNSSETQRITNVLAEALNRSKLSMDQLVLGFQYSANIASDAGVTFEELTAVLAGMSQAGIRSGSMLGTGLRQILMSLAAPTEKITTLLAELGLTTNEVDVRTQGLTGVLENLAKAGLTASQAMGAFETRTAAALVASTNQVAFIRQVQEQFTFTRAAEEAAAKQSEAFKNSMLELKNEFLSFINDGARPILQLLIGVAKTMKDVGNSIGPVVPLLKAMSTALLLVFGAATIASVAKLGAAFLSFSGLTTLASGAMARMALTGSLLTASMTAQVGAAGRLRLALVALQTSVPPLLVISAVAAAVVGFTMAMNKGGDSAEQFKKKLDEQKTKMEEARAGVDQYMQILKQMDDSLARLRDRSDRLKDGSSELRLEVMQGASAFNQYGAGIDATNLKLDDYIERLKLARAGVIALAEEQAQENFDEAKKVSSQEGVGFSIALGNLQNSLFGTLNKKDIDSLGLSSTDARILTEALEVLRNAKRTATDTGELANIANAGSNVNRLLRDTKYSSIASRAQTVGFSAGSTNAALSNMTDAGVTARGLQLMQSPAFTAMQAQFDLLTKGFASIEGELAELARQRASGTITSGEYNSQRETLVNRYGERYRNADTRLGAARDAFMDRNPAPDAIFAFSKIMEQSTEQTSHMKNLLNQQISEIDAANNAAIGVILANLEAPGVSFDTALANAKASGLNVPDTVRSRSGLKTWLETRKSEISNNMTAGRVLGGSSGRGSELSRIEAETIKATNAPASVAAAIREGAAKYGITPEVAMRIASIETGGTFSPTARNPASTARGLFQIMAPTWNQLNPSQPVSTRIDNSDPNDPRYNVEANIDAAMRNLKGNIDDLTTTLGRVPQGWEIYMSHQQGLAGTKALIGADPNANAIDTISKFYRNRQTAVQAITKNGGTANTTAGEFLNIWRGKWGNSSGADTEGTPQSAEEALRNAATQSRRQMEAIAEGAKTVASTAKNLAARTARGVHEFMTDEQSEGAAVTVYDALKQVEDQTKRYYDLKIEALTRFRDTVFSAGAMTQEEFTDLTQQINDLTMSRDNEIERTKEETLATMTKMYRELPNSVGAIGKLFKDIGELLGDLKSAAESSEEQLRVDYEAARDRVLSEVDDRQVAFGRLSGAEANARKALRQKDIREAAQAQQPRLLSDASVRYAAVNSALDTSFGSFGLTARGVTSDRLRRERSTLSSMDPNANIAEYARQKALVEEIEESLASANNLRAEEINLLNEVNALTEASLSGQRGFAERGRLILEGWTEERGIFKDMTNDLLDSIPNILDTTSGAFANFFTEVMNGTASVGDAFRTMAASILKSMMEVVASAAAKQFMRLLVNLGMNFLGGGSSVPNPGGNVPVDLQGLFYEGGFVRRAGGGGVRGRDSVPVLAQPGEYILRKSAVEAIGADNLESLNAAGNRLTSGQAAPKPVSIVAPQGEAPPFNIYVVSPDNVPPPSRENIITWVQEDMINRGPIYKSTKAVQQGAI